MLRAPSQRLFQQSERFFSMNSFVRAGVFGVMVVFSAASHSADLATLQGLPLLTMDKWEYAGGFRFPSGDYGDSNATYAEGIIGLGANGKSMYLVGHPYQQAIGEFAIPALVNSQKVTDFQTATVVQNFKKVLDRPESGNAQGIDRIAGMAYVNGQLVVNTYKYYDASTSVSNTTLVVKNAANLSSSAVAGYHRYSAAAHAVGWISKIPSDWHSELGGTYITGGSSGMPIITRWSVGPSAFVFDPTNPSIGSLSPSAIKTTTLLDFTMEKPVGIDTQSFDNYMFNSSKTNTVWNHLSHAAYGFVVPGTRTYMTVGSNGGMTSGIGYKITQDDGRLCGGYCAYKASDYDNYYWLFDMNDLFKVKSGQTKSYDVKPYSSGRIAIEYAGDGLNGILGGSFDEITNTLYLSLSRGDAMTYGWTPSVVAFKLSGDVTMPSPPLPPGNPSANVID